MKIKKEMVLRNIAGDYVLVPAGASVKEYNGLFAINEVGAAIWDLLEKCETEDEIACALAKEYDAPNELLKKDVTAFLKKLKDLDLI